MRIAITGASGTLGRPLVAALRAKGHDVTGIDVMHTQDGIRADVAELGQLARAFEIAKPDLVYHLAAEFGRNNGEDYYQQVWRTNAIGTKNVLQLQAVHGFKHVFASSSEVYGERAGKLSEDLPLSPLLLTNDYAISKLVNEAQIKNSKERDGTETMVLRFFNAYGPGEFYTPYRSVVALFVYKALHDLPVTLYDGYYRVFQYVDDFIATLARVPEKFKAGETVNVAGNEYRSVQYLWEVIKGFVPETKSDVKVLTQEAHNVRCKSPDVQKAWSLLGHDPRVGLEEGVRRTVEWQRKVYGK